MKTAKTISFKVLLQPVLLLVLIFCFSCSGESINNFDIEADNSVSETVLTESTLAPGEKDGIGTLEMLANFDASSLSLPESIAIDRHGNIYLSMSPLREIWKLDASGSFVELVADFDLEPDLFGINGIKLDNKGNVYVAISSTRSEMNGVWKITEGGEKERIAGTGEIFLPNDLVILPNGTIYITDSAMGAVWRVVPGGEAELWVQDTALEGTGAFGLPVPIGANGIILARKAGKKSTGSIIVANSEKGQLVEIPILPDGSAGEAKIVVSDPGVLFGLDGITQGADGTIYGAVNYYHRIVEINRHDSSVEELAQGDLLDFPTSLAFGTGQNRHTLFITNFSVLHFLSPNPTLEYANPGVVRLSLKP